MRNRGVLAAAMAVALLLAACGGNSQADLAARLATLVGQSEAEVLRRMGPPTDPQAPGPSIAPASGAAMAPAAGQEELHYRVFWPYGGGPNFAIGPNQPLGRSCDITLRMEAGKMVSYRFTGDVCGIGGLPYIAP